MPKLSNHVCKYSVLSPSMHRQKARWRLLRLNHDCHAINCRAGIWSATAIGTKECTWPTNWWTIFMYFLKYWLKNVLFRYRGRVNSMQKQARLTKVTLLEVIRFLVMTVFFCVTLYMTTVVASLVQIEKLRNFSLKWKDIITEIPHLLFVSRNFFDVRCLCYEFDVDNNFHIVKASFLIFYHFSKIKIVSSLQVYRLS